MVAPSADGSRDQKKAWFKQVLNQYLASYKQQGHDDATANRMAQKSLEDYKTQCLEQGIDVE